MAQPKYSMIIQWSDEDGCYVVTLPEWGGCHAHGQTYEEAARNGQEVLQLLMNGEAAAPAAHQFTYPGPAGFTYQFGAPAGSVNSGRVSKTSMARKKQRVAA
jgi:antitoxin HicB